MQKYKHDNLLLIELGVFSGASIMMWADYFKNGTVLGVDKNKKCLALKGDNYTCIQKDLSLPYVLKELANFSPTIVVDDASHIWSHQIMALQFIFPKMPSGAVYILEDINTSFDECKDMYFNDADISAYDFCSAISEFVTGSRSSHLDESFTDYAKNAREVANQVDMITFIHGSCIILKL